MLSYRFLTQRARTLLLACALSATMIAMSAPEAQANEVAQDNPFAHIESFANEIKDYVGAVADGAAERAAEEERAIRRQSVVDEAASHLGVPYVYGGTTPAGFDCSGFTRWVFEHALGVALPRTAAEQSALGEAVSLDEVLPGDLLFWGSGGGVYHVGVYVGDGEYIHAPHTGDVVRYGNSITSFTYALQFY